MSIIDYRGRKAFLLTTDNLIKIDKDPNYSTWVQETIQTARHNDIISVMIVTSMIKSGIPKWLRKYLNHEIYCYRGSLL